MEFKKHALILAVIEGLQARKSRTGKTHVQKTLFFLKETTAVDVPFEFILYKHGPYSFDIEPEIEQMKSYAAIEIEPSGGYGVELAPSQNADFVKRKQLLTDGDTATIHRVCEFVDTQGVVNFERENDSTM